MVFLIIGLLLFTVSANFPYITENIYSSFIYKIIGQSLIGLTSRFPFSLAEIIILISVIIAIAYFFRFGIFLIKLEIRPLIKVFLKIVTVVGIVYLAFQLLWGLNYNRVKLSEMLDLDTKTPTQQELLSVCEDLIALANNLRKDLIENEDNIMELPYGKAGALSIAHKGFESASSYYPMLEGKYGRPKGIMLSRYLCYTGITGFFFPFTGEANVNMHVPDPFFPFVIAHEMAHQLGFAREDEANFIAYITCIAHPDPYFQYSGTLSALNYSMGALRKANEIKYSDLLAKYSEEVARDLIYYNEFWKRYTGPIEKASDKINDTYLKSQNQRAGVKSYGAMVDLLIAEYRKSSSSIIKLKL